MKQIGNFKLYSLDEVKDELIGRVGTPERDEHKRNVENALRTYFDGEAIKRQQLSQEELE